MYVVKTLSKNAITILKLEISRDESRLNIEQSRFFAWMVALIALYFLNPITSVTIFFQTFFIIILFLVNGMTLIEILKMRNSISKQYKKLINHYRAQR